MAGINRTVTDVGYGFTNALPNLAQAPIQVARDPNSNDLATAGTLWVNTATNSVAISAGSFAGLGLWDGIANYPISVNSLPATTANGVTIISGTGAPSLHLPKGSLYLRVDGSSTSTRAYIATNATGTWTNVVTAA